MVKRLLLVLTVVLILYISAYGVARWRKFIVMHETDIKGQRIVARFSGAGWDVRNDWRGGAKNRINPYLVSLFRPLEYIEDVFRGGRKPLEQKPSQ